MQFVQVVAAAHHTAGWIVMWMNPREVLRACWVKEAAERCLLRACHAAVTVWEGLRWWRRWAESSAQGWTCWQLGLALLVQSLHRRLLQDRLHGSSSLSYSMSHGMSHSNVERGQQYEMWPPNIQTICPPLACYQTLCQSLRAWPGCAIIIVRSIMIKCLDQVGDEASLMTVLKLARATHRHRLG